MTKRHFIIIADEIKMLPVAQRGRPVIEAMCRAFSRINQNFNKDRWVRYIGGYCGPSGGKR